MRQQLLVNLGNLLLSLSEVADLANPLIAQHQHRTAFIALELAKISNVKPEITENIFMAALLHDIGAITVEEKIAVFNFNEVNENIDANSQDEFNNGEKTDLLAEGAITGLGR